MRVIVESEEEPQRPTAQETEAEGAVDGGQAPEVGTAAPLAATPAAIDAGPPPQELIDAIGEHPPTGEVAEDIEAGTPAESE